MARRWAKVFAGRLLLLAFGIGLALVLLEGLLRIGATLMSAKPQARSGAVQGARRVLCLGDSNTYGLYVDKSQSYPRVLETLWNSNRGVRPIETLDMGFPVTSSSKLVKEFDRVLLAFRPDVVTVMIGANDFWTVPASAAESPALADRLVAWLWMNSRAYRLFHMMERQLRPPRVEVTTPDAAKGRLPGLHATVRYGGYEFQMGGEPQPKDFTGRPETTDELAQNLESLPARAKAMGAQLVFLTYASEQGFYGWANGFLRTTARKTSTPLIDVGLEMRPLCPRGGCPQWFFPDEHPTAAGYQRVAQIVLRGLQRLESEPEHAE